MKKTLLLLVLFVLLGGLTYKYLNSEKANKKSTIPKFSTAFAVENIDEVHKVFLARMNGENVLFERKGDHWVFDKKYRVAPNSMAFLLQGIQYLNVQYVPTKSVLPKVIQDLSTLGLKVEVYNKADEKIKSYILGGVTQNEEGTFVIMEGGKDPFVAHIPNWVGNLRSRFWFADKRDWRDRSMFHEDVDDIKSITMEYPKNKNKSFKLTKSGNDYDIQTFYDFTPKITKPLRKGAGEAYLMNFESIIAEAYRNENKNKDSIMTTVPFANITLTKTNDEVKKVSLYPINVSGEEIAQQVKMGQSGEDSQIARYFATMDEDFLLVQHRVFNKIFWPYEAFFE